MLCLQDHLLCLRNLSLSCFQISVLHRVYYDLELVKLVVGAGADVNAIDNDGVSLQ